MASKTNMATTLHGLLLLKLNTLYYVEQRLIEALPQMAEAASDPELSSSFTEHLGETKAQLSRLEEALTSLGEKVEPTEVAAIDGMIEDAQWCIQNIEQGPALDAVLIAAAQQVEHYETASYGSALAWANLMDHAAVSELLAETLEEEENADEKLSALAFGGINERANLEIVEADEE
jgi:ferritin-like metal-binding protein YciE